MESKKIRWEAKNIAELNSLAVVWDRLNSGNNNQSVLSYKFIQALLNSFSSGDETLVLGWQDDHLVFGAIFEKLSGIRWRTFQPSQAPLGCIICSVDLLTFDVFSQVSKLLPGTTLLLDLTQVDSQQIPLPVVKNLFTMPYITTGSLNVPKDFEQYFANFSKNTRQNFNKGRNRLTKLDIAARLEIVTDKISMKSFVSKYGEIESSGWKNAEGTAIHVDNQQGKFYVELLSNFAEQNEAQIWCYYFNEEVVAVDLCIIMSDTLVILKTTYEEKHAKYSPSLLMKLDAYKKLGIDGNIKTIEYFGKTKDWHKRLQCEEREIYHITWCKFPHLFKLFNWFKKFK